MRKLAIIGLGPSSGNIPDDCEKWGLPWGKDYSLDRYFELHENWRTKKDIYHEDPEAALNDFSNVVFMENYPLSEITRIFGNYLECSIAYMLALGILERWDEIYLLGVSGDDGYISQRPNLEYLIGYGRALGTKIIVDDNSKLLKSEFKKGLYGYGD